MQLDLQVEALVSHSHRADVSLRTPENVRSSSVWGQRSQPWPSPFFPSLVVQCKSQLSSNPDIDVLDASLSQSQLFSRLRVETYPFIPHSRHPWAMTTLDRPLGTARGSIKHSLQTTGFMVQLWLLHEVIFNSESTICQLFEPRQFTGSRSTLNSSTLKCR